MKLMISVDIMLMTLRQQINPKQNSSQSCDLNFSTKWSSVSSRNLQVSVTGIYGVNGQPLKTQF